jgi:hypothetical protein
LTRENYLDLKSRIAEWSGVITKNIDDLKETIKKGDIEKIDTTLKRFDREIKEITDTIITLKLHNASLNFDSKFDIIEKSLNEIKIKIVEMDKVTSKNLSDFKSFRNLSEQFDKNYTDDIRSLKEKVNVLNTFKEKSLMAFSVVNILIAIAIGVLTAIGQLS